MAHQIAFVNRYHKYVAENPANAHVTIAYPTEREVTSERSNLTTLGAPNRVAPTPNQMRAVNVIELRGVELTCGTGCRVLLVVALAFAHGCGCHCLPTSRRHQQLRRGALRLPIGV